MPPYLHKFVNNIYDQCLVKMAKIHIKTVENFSVDRVDNYLCWLKGFVLVCFPSVVHSAPSRVTTRFQLLSYLFLLLWLTVAVAGYVHNWWHHLPVCKCFELEGVIIGGIDICLVGKVFYSNREQDLPMKQAWLILWLTLHPHPTMISDKEYLSTFATEIGESIFWIGATT